MHEIQFLYGWLSSNSSSFPWRCRRRGTSSLSTSDPESGEPYIILKAGRPDWDKEFVDLATMYGREDIGVVFCGAPLIAAALKSACEKHSDRNKTVFRLHKENF